MKTVAIYYSSNDFFGLHISYGLSAIKKKSEEFEIYKIDKSNIDSNIRKIANTKPNLIVIFVSFHSYELLLECSKELGRLVTDTCICICHNVASALSKKILNNMKAIDLAIIGEFEATLSELCEIIKEKKDFRKCKGIAYLENNIYITNPNRQDTNIEEIDYPDRDAFPNNKRYFSMMGSRGCEGNCTFCDRNYLNRLGNNNTPRFRNIVDIVNEIDYLVKHYNCKFISFNDATFCSNSNINNRLYELYKALKYKKYWVQFLMCLRSEQINTEVIELLENLKKVGLGKVYIGIESFNEFDLGLYNKGTNYKQNINAIKLLQGVNNSKEDYQLKFGYGFINFNPYSTVAGLVNNLNNFNENSMHIDPYILCTKVSLNYLTPLTKKVDQDNLFTKKLLDFSLKELMERRYNYKFSEKEVQDIYSIMSLSCSHLDYKNINGSEFIRNRYFHFYGYDDVIKRFDAAYEMWLNEVTLFSSMLFRYILTSDCDFSERLKYAINFTENFKAKYNACRNKLKSIQQRAMVSLQKKDELIYNHLWI